MNEDIDPLSKPRKTSNGQIVQRTHTWEINDPAEAQKVRREILRQLHTIPILPRTAVEREFLGDEVWDELQDRFARQEKLSQADIGHWRSVPNHMLERDEKARLVYRRGLEINHAFDLYLIEQFGVWGSRLLVSTQVTNRVFQWEIHHADLVKSYADALSNRASAVHRRRGAKLQISGLQIRKLFQQLLPGLRTLFRKARTSFGKLESERSNSKLALFLEKEIDDNPEAYSDLSAYLPELIVFINSRDSRFSSRIRNGQIRPEGFLYLLLGETTGYSRIHLKRLRIEG